MLLDRYRAYRDELGLTEQEFETLVEDLTAIITNIVEDSLRRNDEQEASE